jgi:hypothetical protein
LPRVKETATVVTATTIRNEREERAMDGQSWFD